MDVGRHPNITLLTLSEVKELTGEPGNFTARVLQHARYVEVDKCTACDDCTAVCPVETDNEFELGLSKRKAIFKAFPQAVPSAFSISRIGHPPCRVACPAGVNAQGYIALIRAGKYKEALELERSANPFASVCGRVCNHPCESECVRGDVDEPIAIASLKRFCADFGSYPLEQKEPTGEKVGSFHGAYHSFDYRESLWMRTLITLHHSVLRSKPTRELVKILVWIVCEMIFALFLLPPVPTMK
ncbi:hypothetical protein AMJ87_07585 [candidate division WOR_3 bacterium SM23_60]|uniref:4Fe-4S ferredoxin-type domain-containing protein n=1 Tax=candidate division WOR_3 bacterium SM23_60 TaxID=1703780 RepID=A0A0S8GFU8_UNCW3|nr:MAG: hypothetical protein AMJ87_07585 [candidate division WOR_3 bacterium SM23_60]